MEPEVDQQTAATKAQEGLDSVAADASAMSGETADVKHKLAVDYINQIVMAAQALTILRDERKNSLAAQDQFFRAQEHSDDVTGSPLVEAELKEEHSDDDSAASARDNIALAHARAHANAESISGEAWQNPTVETFVNSVLQEIEFSVATIELWETLSNTAREISEAEKNVETSAASARGAIASDDLVTALPEAKKASNAVASSSAALVEAEKILQQNHGILQAQQDQAAFFLPLSEQYDQMSEKYEELNNRHSNMNDELTTLLAHIRTKFVEYLKGFETQAKSHEDEFKTAMARFAEETGPADADTALRGIADAVWEFHDVLKKFEPVVRGQLPESFLESVGAEAGQISIAMSQILDDSIVHPIVGLINDHAALLESERSEAVMRAEVIVILNAEEADKLISELLSSELSLARETRNDDRVERLETALQLVLKEQAGRASEVPSDAGLGSAAPSGGDHGTDGADERDYGVPEFDPRVAPPGSSSSVPVQTGDGEIFFRQSGEIFHFGGLDAGAGRGHHTPEGVSPGGSMGLLSSSMDMHNHPLDRRHVVEMPRAAIMPTLLPRGAATPWDAPRSGPPSVADFEGDSSDGSVHLEDDHHDTFMMSPADGPRDDESGAVSSPVSPRGSGETPLTKSPPAGAPLVLDAGASGGQEDGAGDHGGHAGEDGLPRRVATPVETTSGGFVGGWRVLHMPPAGHAGGDEEDSGRPLPSLVAGQPPPPTLPVPAVASLILGADGSGDPDGEGHALSHDGDDTLRPAQSPPAVASLILGADGSGDQDGEGHALSHDGDLARSEGGGSPLSLKVPSFMVPACGEGESPSSNCAARASTPGTDDHLGDEAKSEVANVSGKVGADDHLGEVGGEGRSPSPVGANSSLTDRSLTPQPQVPAGGLGADGVDDPSSSGGGATSTPPPPTVQPLQVPFSDGPLQDRERDEDVSGDEEAGEHSGEGADGSHDGKVDDPARPGGDVSPSLSPKALALRLPDLTSGEDADRSHDGNGKVDDPSHPGGDPDVSGGDASRSPKAAPAPLTPQGPGTSESLPQLTVVDRSVSGDGAGIPKAASLTPQGVAGTDDPLSHGLGDDTLRPPPTLPAVAPLVPGADGSGDQDGEGDPLSHDGDDTPRSPPTLPAVAPLISGAHAGERELIDEEGEVDPPLSRELGGAPLSTSLMLPVGEPPADGPGRSADGSPSSPNVAPLTPPVSDQPVATPVANAPPAVGPAVSVGAARSPPSSPNAAPRTPQDPGADESLLQPSAVGPGVSGGGAGSPTSPKAAPRTLLVVQPSPSSPKAASLTPPVSGQPATPVANMPPVVGPAVSAGAASTPPSSPKPGSPTPPISSQPVTPDANTALVANTAPGAGSNPSPKARTLTPPISSQPATPDANTAFLATVPSSEPEPKEPEGPDSDQTPSPSETEPSGTEPETTQPATTAVAKPLKQFSIDCNAILAALQAKIDVGFFVPVVLVI